LTVSLNKRLEKEHINFQIRQIRLACCEMLRSSFRSVHITLSPYTSRNI